MSQTTSLVSIAANRGITGALFGIAIITYAARTYIRTFAVKQFFMEDALLLFAVICLCGTTGLALSNMQSLYNSLAVILHGPDLGLLLDTLNHIPEISKRNNAAATLWWCVIYPVKLAFLFFFRRLIIRLRGVYLWWWWALAFTLLAWIGATVADWLTCPFTNATKVLLCGLILLSSEIDADERKTTACSGSAGEFRVIRDTAITTAVDVTTDIIVLSFPIILLWKVRVGARQKFALGISLCLSIVMIVVAVIRISAFRLTNGEVDIVWLAFWQQQECSIAVTVVSISAFRSLFVAASTNKLKGRPLRQSVNNWKRRIERRRLGPTTDEKQMPITSVLPQVPSPTLTGMSSVLRHCGGQSESTSERTT